MTDVFSAEKRSAVMRGIRSSDTKPEVIVRRLLFASGLRFRLRRADLPGQPDIVLAKWRTVVFVNGCFWHQHPGCTRATLPSTRKDYWLPKLARNVERDAQEHKALLDAGWRVLIVWECACLKSFREELRKLLSEFVRGGAGYGEIERSRDEQRLFLKTGRQCLPV